jgi:predicted hotdog family 3-hydroxylacyl-ACP dehydratase
MKSELTLPLDAEKLIPHRKPVCMVDRLIEFNDQTGTVEAVVPSENALIEDNGQLDQLAVTEMIAQACAAAKGYEGRLSNDPMKLGFLVGIKKLQFFGKAFAGDHLQISVRTVGAISGFTVVEGVVICNQKIIAAGKIKLWVPEPKPSEEASE